MSQRITTAVREKIVHAVLRHRFNAEIDALADKFAALADEIYNDNLTAEEQALMASLPKGWVAEENDIGVRVGDSSCGFDNLTFSGSRSYRFGHSDLGTKREPVIRLVPHKFFRQCWKTYPARHALAIKYEKLKAEEDRLQETIGDAERQTKAALGKFVSVKALLNEWPEIAPFVPQAERPVTLPALPVASLNESLKLPVAS